MVGDTNPGAPAGTRLASNTAVAIVTNVWSIVTSLLMIPLLVRGLGPGQFGAWALIQAFSAITGWASILDLGLGVGSARAIGSRAGAGRSHDVLRSIAASLVVFGALGAMVLFLSAALTATIYLTVGIEWTVAGSTLSNIVILTGVQASIDLASRGPISVLDGLQRTDQSRASDAVRRSLFLGASGVAAIISGDLLVTLLAGLGASLVAMTVPLLLVRRHLTESLSWPQRSEVSELLRESRTVGLLRPLGVVNRTMDKFILGGSIGLSAVGSLEVASSLQAGANAVVSAATDPITPAAAYVSGSGGNDRIPDLALRMTRISIAISAPLIITLVTVPDVLLDIWLGEHVPTMAASFTALSCLALFISALTTPLTNCLVGCGETRVVVATAVLATALNLILSIVFVAGLGALGVLVGTIASSLFTMPAIIGAGKRAFGICGRDLVLSACLPGLAPSLPLVLGLVVARGSHLDSDLGWISLIALLMILTSAVTYRVALLEAERSSVRRLAQRPRRVPRR